MFTNHLWDHSGLRLDGTLGARFRFEFTGQTFLGVFVGTNKERLRPKDFESLKDNADFGSNFKGVSVETGYFKSFTLQGEYSRWQALILNRRRASSGASGQSQHR